MAINMRHGLAVAASLAISPVLATSAQGAFLVTPAANAAVEGGGASFGALGNGAAPGSTFQFFVAASELTAITVGAQINSIGFRLDGSAATISNAIQYSRYDIQVGTAVNPVSSPTLTFASNTGGDTILVRSGALTIPGGSLSNTGVPGTNPFFDIGFANAYTYTGGNLAITIRVLGSSTGIGADAVTPGGTNGTALFAIGASAQSSTNASGNVPVTRLGFVTTAVPEPATWAMMLIGFGAVGRALRQRPRVSSRVRFA